MSRQVFAVVNTPDTEYEIPNGSIAEVLLDRCDGFDGFIMARNNDDLTIRFGNDEYLIPKDWLCDFWVV
jgi:hypothetical protein